MTKRTVGLLVVLSFSILALRNRSTLQAWAYGMGKAGREQIGRVAPELPASTKTVEGKTLKLADERGKVVLLHFWTFGCSNCKTMLPWYTKWDDAYRSRGLTTIGVHTPELEYERSVEKLAAFIKSNKIKWPVVLDPDYAAWHELSVEAWPTVVLIDRKGVIRGVYVGDDQAGAIESAVQKLL